MNAGFPLPPAPRDVQPMSGPEFEGLLASASPGQIALWLDGLRDDARRYLKLWRAIMAGLGGSVTAQADGMLVSAMPFDPPPCDNADRFNALTTHLAQSGHRDALLASLKAADGGHHA